MSWPPPGPPGGASPSGPAGGGRQGPGAGPGRPTWHPVAPPPLATEVPTGLPRPKLDRGRGRTTLIVVVAVVALLGVAGVITLAALRSDSTQGSVLTLVLAAVPVPLLVGAYLWLDRYEPEPMRFLASALVWGAVVAVALAALLEWLASVPFDASERVLAVGVAPVAEEGAKGLFVVLVVVWRRHIVGGVLDGLIYAGLVGVGFAFTENVLYYSGAYSGLLDPAIKGVVGTSSVFFVRGLLSPFAHPLFTSAIGLGIAVAITTRHRWARYAAPVAGFALAVGLHAAWNGSALIGGPKAFLLTYSCAMLPLLAAGIGLAAWARAREQKILTRALVDAAARGWLHPAEVHWLVRLGDRGAARRYAGRVAGPQAVKALRAYQQASTEMAFMHDRVLRGTAPADGIQRVHAHLRRMQSWRPYVVLPPVSWSAPIGPAGPPTVPRGALQGGRDRG